MSESGNNAIRTLFSILLFALLIIAPVKIARSYNDYAETFWAKNEMKRYLEDIVVEDLTYDNYAAFQNTLSKVGMAADIEVTRGNDYYTMREVCDRLATTRSFGIEKGDFVEVTVYGDKVILYKSQIIGEN